MTDKDWIQDRADIIAADLYDADLYTLSQLTQDTIYALANADYNDHIAHQIEMREER